MKKVAYLLTIIILLIGINPVSANTNNNIVDFSKKGNITITLNDGTESGVVEGANIKIYKLADAYSKNSNLAFSYYEDIEKYQNDINENNLNEEILESIYNSNIFTMEDTTDNNGYVSFNDLDLGLYLVEQTNQVEGYSKIDSFLVYLPQVEDNKWIYEIVATPKIDIIRLMDVIVEKKWDAISDNTPEQVTIQLLKKDEIIDTVILNKENNWTYTWKQIEASDEYEVLEINIPTGYTATYRQVENKFIVTNTKTLVQTGQNIFLIQLLTLLGLLFIIIGIVCEKRKKYE